MSTVTSILATDIISSSRGVINTNFTNLNVDKLEAATVAQVLSADVNTVAITPSTYGATFKKVYKPAAQSVISSVLTNDVDLLFPINAGEVWAIKGYLGIESAAVPDFKYTFSLPSGATANWMSIQTFNNETQTTPVTFSTTGGVTIPETIIGNVICASVSGTVQLQWAQNTNAVSSVTTLTRGSYLIANRII